jgi:hypothetical protein
VDSFRVTIGARPGCTVEIACPVALDRNSGTRGFGRHLACWHKIEFNFLNGNLMVRAGPAITWLTEPTDGLWAHRIRRVGFHCLGDGAKTQLMHSESQCAGPRAVRRPVRVYWRRFDWLRWGR